MDRTVFVLPRCYPQAIMQHAGCSFGYHSRNGAYFFFVFGVRPLFLDCCKRCTGVADAQAFEVFNQHASINF